MKCESRFGDFGSKLIMNLQQTRGGGSGDGDGAGAGDGVGGRGDGDVVVGMVAVMVVVMFVVEWVKVGVSELPAPLSR